MRPCRFTNTFAALLLAAVAASSASGDVVWYEVTNGDLSNDQFHPTPITLGPGISTVIGAVNGETDLQDWMAITIPTGFQLSAMVLGDYDSLDTVAFAGVQVGPAFLGDPFSADSYLGYSHIGPDLIGTDLLPLMGDPLHAPGSQGFTPPLASGVYTFLAQQLGDDSLYEFDFEVTPVPAPASLGLVAGGLLVCRRLRRSSSAGPKVASDSIQSKDDRLGLMSPATLQTAFIDPVMRHPGPKNHQNDGSDPTMVA